MALTLLQVENAARDLSPWFDRARVPGGVSARMLSEIERDLMAKAVRIDPDLMATATTVSVVTGGSATSFAASHDTILRLEAVFTDTATPNEYIPLIPEARAIDYAHERAGFLRGTSLYLTGASEDWTGVASVKIWYLALTSGLSESSTDATTLTIADDAKGALAARLAFMFALRVNGMPLPSGEDTIEIDVASYDAIAERAEFDWLRRVLHQKQRKRAAQKVGL